MATNSGAEEFAEKIREAQKSGMAWLNVISDHTDVCDMHHEPVTPMDGPTKGEQMRALNDMVQAQIKRLFPNGHKVEGPVTVEGNVVTTDFTLKGVTAKGTAVEAGSVAHWTIENGRIVASMAKSRPGPTGAQEALTRAFAEAGIEMPSPEQAGSRA